MTVKSEDTFLVSYVLFDKKPGAAEVDVVEAADNYLKHKISTGEFKLPPGTSYVFAGSYENQVRSEKTLTIVIPLASNADLHGSVFSVPFYTCVTKRLFGDICCVVRRGSSCSGVYSQPWFLDFNVFGVNMRELFQVRHYNLSVAVVGGIPGAIRNRDERRRDLLHLSGSGV